MTDATRPEPPEWTPANGAEAVLRRCRDAGDLDGFLTVLCFADLFLPGPKPVAAPAAAAAAPTAAAVAAPHGAPAGAQQPGRQRLLTTRHGDRTYVAVYTSPEAMYRAVGDLVVGWHLTNMSDLAAGWPDERWGLAVNPGLSPGGYLDPGEVAELGRIVAATPPFQAGAAVERLLYTAARNADLDAYLILLSQAPLLVRPGTPVRVDHDDRGPLVAAYTSALRVDDDGGDPAAMTSTDLAALGRDWPDPDCRLVVNRASVLEVVIDGYRMPALPGEIAEIIGTAPN